MLSRIPAELVILVAFELNRSSLLDLILCCRQFHDLLLPYLYRSLYLMNPNGGYNSRLRSLVETVAQNPRIAGAVRHIRFGLSFGEPNKVESNGSASFASSLVPTLCDSKEMQTRWYKDLAEGDADSWVALLLPQLRNLQRLYVRVDGEMTYFYKPFESAASGLKSIDTQPAFSALTHVTLSWYDGDGGGLKLSRTLPFFKLPSLRSFTGIAITEGYFNNEVESDLDYEFDDELVDDSDSLLEQSSLAGSPITELEFYASNGTHGMFNAIRSCAKLEKFTYEHADGARDGDGFNPCAFRRSLENSKTTLQSLWLDYDENHYSLGYDNENDYFGSLVEFTALRNVRLRINQLFGLNGTDGGEPKTPLTDSLPFSLESLWITDCYDTQLPTIVSQLMTVVSNHHERTPHLAELGVQGEFASNPGYREHFTWAVSPNYRVRANICEETELLRKACEGADIKFEIIDYHSESSKR